MAKTKRLRTVADTDGRVVANLIGGKGFLGTAPDGATYRCGACGETLAEHVAEHEVMNVVFVCPFCRANNDVPAGPPQSGPEVHLLPGTYNLSDVVRGQPGKRLRGVSGAE